jgi:hypothetical protein
MNNQNENTETESFVLPKDPPTLYWVSIILFLLFLFFASFLFYDYKVKQLQENVLLLQSEIHRNLSE